MTWKKWRYSTPPKSRSPGFITLTHQIGTLKVFKDQDFNIFPRQQPWCCPPYSVKIGTDNLDRKSRNTSPKSARRMEEARIWPPKKNTIYCIPQTTTPDKTIIRLTMESFEKNFSCFFPLFASFFYFLMEWVGAKTFYKMAFGWW